MPEGVNVTDSKGNDDEEKKLLNYKNTATPVHPLIVQLYRCELDEAEEGGEEDSKRVENGEEGEAGRKKKEKSPPDPIYRADEHNCEFDPDKYLEGFYKSPREDVAMQIVLFFLPGLACRLPRDIPRMLDLGAGPTVYIPLTLRQHVEQIFSSDYSPVNRQRVQDWAEAKKGFDWSEICRWITNLEAKLEQPEDMERLTRGKMKAILEVDVHKRPIVRGVHWKADDFVDPLPEQFELVATIFCLEYSCETLEGYQRAIQAACSLVKPGGWLIQGGIFHATEYCFGGKRFSSHFLTREHVFSALRENGMHAEKGPEHDQFHFISHDDIFLLLSRKKTD